MDEESPGLRKLWIVIAVIAVIVVILATLYVMVLPPPHVNHHDIAGSILEFEADSPTEAHIIFGAFTEDVRTSDLKIFFHVNGTYIGVYLAWTDDGSVKWFQDTSLETVNITANYVDNNEESPYLMSGESLELGCLEPGIAYSVEVFHQPTMSTISMAGDWEIVMPAE